MSFIIISQLVFEETFDMIGAPITLLVTTLPAIFFLGFGKRTKAALLRHKISMIIHSGIQYYSQ